MGVYTDAHEIHTHDETRLRGGATPRNKERLTLLITYNHRRSALKLLNARAFGGRRPGPASAGRRHLQQTAEDFITPIQFGQRHPELETPRQFCRRQ